MSASGSLSLAEPDEYPAISKLWQASWDSIGISNEHDLTGDTLLEQLIEEVAGGWQLYAYREDDELLAMLALDPSKNYLRQIFVAPHAQGRGIGRHLFEYAKAQMPNEIKLNTPELNTRALNWYLREGFEVVRVRTNKSFERNVVDMNWRA